MLKLAPNLPKHQPTNLSYSCQLLIKSSQKHQPTNQIQEKIYSWQLQTQILLEHRTTHLNKPLISKSSQERPM